MRQQAYEDLISYLTFVCTNKSYGDIDVLKFEEVQEHDRSCRYQCTSYPLFTSSLIIPNLTGTGQIKRISYFLQIWMNHLDLLSDFPDNLRRPEKI